MIIILDKVENARKEGKLGKIDITFTKDGGKSAKRTLVTVGKTKEVIEVFRQDGAVGKTYDVTLEKDGEFWNWVAAKEVPAGAAAAEGGAKTYQAKSTYETPEERARRNVSICRQNALTNAVVFMTAKSNKATPEEVLDVAAHFAAWTTGAMDINMDSEPANAAPPAIQPSKDFDDDLPF